ncbi:protein kinase, cAMP-dependent, catalytic chain [Reticulomyxa filosa]|uniref:cGMP-dependent protein kinase n=1 Tax=Reticulomyxa filosa TaxID=46433 RepID=X6NDX9_RETFI|nr:protein kinase, cAMP-dependent, catalytic chain [Reticulomyxa filosa]|eukprot:ETO24530.1 protein kinase, cAMP-dependent, catalytic chain [Reticulomyxa filosa]
MFRKILIRVSDEKLAEYERFLREVPLLDSLLSNERRAVAEALDEVKYQKGDVIIRQGDIGDTDDNRGDWAGRRGEEKASGQRDKASHTWRLLWRRALIKNDVRSATVKVIDNEMTCLCLDREAFALLLGPLAELMRRKIDEDNAIASAAAAAMNSNNNNNKNNDNNNNDNDKPKKQNKNNNLDESGGDDAMQSPNNANANPNTNVSVKFRLHIPKQELITVGILGKGSFGSVELVKHKKSGKTYALKQVSKQQIVETGQQEHIINEKNVQMILDSQFVVKLYQTYKDKKYLYFLLEVVLGGELFTVLRARTVFDEDTARFYAASVVSAFDYMHSKDIIYRDLKPENLLLNDKGYLKIADFGFAKMVKDWDRTYTLCGTPDYLAPEIINGVGHGKGVDWWTLGVLIFEMLASYPPFVDDDPMKTYAKIMLGKVKYPNHFSAGAIEIVRGFLVAKPTKRLGIIHGGATKIHKQSWFDTFDWDALFDGNIPAPIIPKITGDEDRSNFEVGIYSEIKEKANNIHSYTLHTKSLMMKTMTMRTMVQAGTNNFRGQNKIFKAFVVVLV